MRRLHLLLAASATLSLANAFRNIHQPLHHSLAAVTPNTVVLLAKKKKGGKGKRRTAKGATAAGADAELPLPPPMMVPQEGLMAIPPPSDTMQQPATPPMPMAPRSDGAVMPAQIDDFDDDWPPLFDGPAPAGGKLNLPSFDDYVRSGVSKPQPTDEYQSKLSPINQGKPVVIPEDEKPLFERLVFGLTWGGIITLVLIECAATRQAIVNEGERACARATVLACSYLYLCNSHALGGKSLCLQPIWRLCLPPS